MCPYNWSIVEFQRNDPCRKVNLNYQLRYGLNKKIIANEFNFKAVRASGAGGQHVNKVSSRVELSFNVQDSKGLTIREKNRLYLKLENRLTIDKTLLLQCDDSRSQHKNKDLVKKRFFDLLKKALHVPKKRKPTKPSKSSIEKRLKSKKITAQKKSSRKPPEIN